MDEKILVTQSFLPPLEEYVEQLKGIWDSHWLTNNGILHGRFENSLKEYLRAQNITLFVNGHMALDIALKTLQIKGEIITTPFTFVSTSHAIMMNGLKPVFVDIKLNNYTIDENKIEELITPETSAIVAVHVYGQPCNTYALGEIAKKHNLRLIYDAAHAFGVQVDGNPIASFGDISMFSFHATKVFHSIEGGALAYSDDTMTLNLNRIKNFGIDGPESVTVVGLNAKMNEFSAAMGLCNLLYIDEQIIKRKTITNLYNECLGKVKGIVLPVYPDNIVHNYSYYPILVNELEYGFTRDCLFEELEKHGILARKYFYPLVSDMTCYQGQFTSYDLPIARYVSDRILCLPMYGELQENTVKRICMTIDNFKNNKL